MVALLLTRWVAVACAALKHKNFGFEMIAVPADEFPSGGAETPFGGGGGGGISPYAKPDRLTRQALDTHA